MMRLLLPCSSSPPPQWPPPLEVNWRSPRWKPPPCTRRSVSTGSLKAAATPSPPLPDDGESFSSNGNSSLLPNARRRQRDPMWRGGFSLGVDLGDSRTGLALGKGFAPPRPLAVLELRGQKLELKLMEIAEREEVDEFIVGLPISWDGKETQQSNKVRSITGRLAIRAAERGWRTYLLDEHGTTEQALDYMIDMGHKKSARQQQIDSYSAMMVLERYFSTMGHGVELILPKQLQLQEILKRGSFRDTDS